MKDLSCHSRGPNSFTIDFCETEEQDFLWEQVWLCFLGKGDCFSAFLPLHSKSLTYLGLAHVLQLQQPGSRTGSDPGRSHLKFSIADF